MQWGVLFLSLLVLMWGFFVLFWVLSFYIAQIKLFNDFPKFPFGRSVPYFHFFPPSVLALLLSSLDSQRLQLDFLANEIF